MLQHIEERSVLSVLLGVFEDLQEMAELLASLLLLGVEFFDE